MLNPSGGIDRTTSGDPLSVGVANAGTITLGRGGQVATVNSVLNPSAGIDRTTALDPLSIGGTNAGTVTIGRTGQSTAIGGNLNPVTNNTSDLGSNANRWHSLTLGADLTVHGNAKIGDASSTIGFFGAGGTTQQARPGAPSGSAGSSGDCAVTTCASAAATTSALDSIKTHITNLEDRLRDYGLLSN